MKSRRPELYEHVILLRDLESDEDAVIPMGTEGHVVEVLRHDEFILEFTFPDPRLVGGRVETCLAEIDDFVVVAPKSAPLSVSFDRAREPVAVG